MELTNRTVFIVGGTSGIGLGLARRLAASGNTVVVGGRSAADVTDGGIDTVTVDVTGPASVTAARDQVLADHPDLDAVIITSGVMLPEDLRDPAHIENAETIVAINLLGTIRTVDAFTPHLIARGAGSIVTVSSGIGFLPFPLMPTYGASKAAVHSYTDSLRAQLDGTGVEVIEIVPPAVATKPGQKELNPAALDLDTNLDETLRLLATSPTPHEILVDAVTYLRWAERDGTYEDLLTKRSASLQNLPGR